MSEKIHSITEMESRLSTARSALAKTGKNPQKLAEENRLEVISWIYLWGFTSPGIIQSLLNRTSAGYGKRLVETGWLTATKAASGTPAKFFTLSKQGLEFAEYHALQQYRYAEIDPQRVDQKIIRHNLITQAATINLLHSNLIESFETERMFSKAGDQLNIKRPDIIWNLKNDLRIAVEIELSGKWGRDLDKFIFEIIHALKSDENGIARCSRFSIVSDSPALIKRYQDAMQPSCKLRIWQKNARSHWEVRETIPMPNWLMTKVDFHLMER